MHKSDELHGNLIDAGAGEDKMLATDPNLLIPLVSAMGFEPMTS